MRSFCRFVAVTGLSCIFMLAAAGVSRAAAGNSGAQKESFTFEGRKHTFYLFIPDSPPADVAAPLVLLLHGVNERGPSLATPWHTLASKEGIILVAPDATNMMGWDIRDDHPDFFHALIESAKEKHAVDSQRMYIFGHSNGGVFGLSLALLESRYFAAVAVHAGALCSPDGIYLPCSAKARDQMLAGATRKIPVALWSGTLDRNVPTPRVQESKIVLQEHGFPVEFHSMAGRTHNYYEHADEVDEWVWAFLRQHELSDPPQFQSYKH